MGAAEEIKALEEKLDYQLNILNLEREESLNILKHINVNCLKDQISLYEDQLSECLKMQREVRRLKLKEKTSMEEIKTYENQISNRRDQVAI